VARRRLSMRKVREVLRLRHELGLGLRQIARSLGLSHSRVAGYLGRAEAAGVPWPLAEDLGEAELEARLFPGSEGQGRRRPEPDWGRVHRELRRKGVTLQLLWLEYKREHPNGYQSSRFCDLYRRWLKTADPVMRHVHRAGEKVFVDWAELTVPVVDSATGEVREAYVFVGALGASNDTHAEAYFSQALPAWITAHWTRRRSFWRTSWAGSWTAARTMRPCWPRDSGILGAPGRAAGRPVWGADRRASCGGAGGLRRGPGAPGAGRGRSGQPTAWFDAGRALAPRRGGCVSFDV